MKSSRNQRLSEHLLNVDEEILTNAYHVDDAEKLKVYKKTKHTGNRPIYAVRKAVWVPAVAAAACVVLAVGLWQGGVFDPTPIPVETPDEGATTTGETTEPYILVGGEEDLNSLQKEAFTDRLVSPALEEKMKEYRDVNAVFQVVVYGVTNKDYDEAMVLLKNTEEYQSLRNQSKEAHKAANKAYELYFKYREDTLQNEAEKAVKKADKIDRQITELTMTFTQKFLDSRREERISYAAKYSKTEPVSGYGWSGGGYYMELTADAINELANRGGYEFYLASEKIDLSKLIED